MEERPRAHEGLDRGLEPTGKTPVRTLCCGKRQDSLKSFNLSSTQDLAST